jgi:hypothetical protein
MVENAKCRDQKMASEQAFGEFAGSPGEAAVAGDAASRTSTPAGCSSWTGPAATHIRLPLRADVIRRRQPVLRASTVISQHPPGLGCL